MMVKKHEQNMHGKIYEWSWTVKVRMNPPRPPSKTSLTVIFQFEGSWLSKIAAQEFMALRTNSKAVVIQAAPGL
ncbi:putative Isoflavone reductaseRL [Fusarium oxysporum f. sp. albedinis]|nr:putative Isoflavone reductaseRL [Fusarium oxysporum f. sp. albedinis]